MGRSKGLKGHNSHGSEQRMDIDKAIISESRELFRVVAAMRKQ